MASARSGSLDRRSGPPRSRDDEPLGRATARRDLDDRAPRRGRAVRRHGTARRPRPASSSRLVVLADAAEQRRGRLPRERARRVHRDIVDLAPGWPPRPARHRRSRASARATSERSCWRTSPAIRTTTRPKRVIEAAVTTIMSMSRRWKSCTRLIAGATSDAHVSSASRNRVSIGSRGADRCSICRHRRMQCRRAPQEVEADPADVEPELVDIGAVEDQQAVDEVGRQQQDDARADQVERGRAPAAVEREPDRRREQQHVPERICDRHQLGDRRQLVVVQVRRHQRDPLRQREPDREDQPVDHAAAVAADCCGARSASATRPSARGKRARRRRRRAKGTGRRGSSSSG